jgi:methylmalonyl-CoA/ethylmalonyl-CoA epimerase
VNYQIPKVAKFVERHGEGVMIISLNVDNTRGAIGQLKEKGYPFIGGGQALQGLRIRLYPPKGSKRRTAGADRLQVG